MKVETTFEYRPGELFTSSYSLPKPTVPALEQLVRALVWVSQKPKFTVKLVED